MQHRRSPRILRIEIPAALAQSTVQCSTVIRCKTIGFFSQNSFCPDASGDASGNAMGALRSPGPGGPGPGLSGPSPRPGSSGSWTPRRSAVCSRATRSCTACVRSIHQEPSASSIPSIICKNACGFLCLMLPRWCGGQGQNLLRVAWAQHGLFVHGCVTRKLRPPPLGTDSCPSSSQMHSAHSHAKMGTRSTREITSRRPHLYILSISAISLAVSRRWLQQPRP